jgi:hypothetical protein
MRTLFTLFLFALTAFYASAQSLQVSGPNGVLAPDAVVTVTASTTSTEIIAQLKVANIGNDTLMVLCKKEEVSLVPGSVNMFCWTQCYGPGTYVSPEPLRFDPGMLTAEFLRGILPQWEFRNQSHWLCLFQPGQPQ